MKRFTFFGVALSLALFAAPAVAKDDAATQQAKTQIAWFKKYAKKAKDDTTYANLVVELSDTGHPLCAEFLGKRMLKSKDLEHQLIIADVLSQFRAREDGREAAGDALLKALDKGDYEIDVIDSIANSLGKLTYKPATLPLCEILKKGGDPWLLVTTVRALGKIEDVRALPTLLELWERNPVGYSWETGEVTVDTGAPGTADQEAAEAAWHAKYGNSMKAKGKPPVMFKVYIQELAKTVNQVVAAYVRDHETTEDAPADDMDGDDAEAAEGDENKIGQPSDLRKWMEARAKPLRKLGVEIPKYKGPPLKDKDDKKKKKKK